MSEPISLWDALKALAESDDERAMSVINSASAEKILARIAVLEAERDGLKKLLADVRQDRNIAIKWFPVHEELDAIFGIAPQEFECDPETHLAIWKRCIATLTAENESLQARLREVERERDAAWELLKLTCDAPLKLEVAQQKLAHRKIQRDELVDGIRHAIAILLDAVDSGLSSDATRELMHHLMGTITDSNGQAMQTSADVAEQRADAAEAARDQMIEAYKATGELLDAAEAKLAAVRERLQVCVMTEGEHAGRLIADSGNDYVWRTGPGASENKYRPSDLGGRLLEIYELVK